MGKIKIKDIVVHEPNDLNRIQTARVILEKNGKEYTFGVRSSYLLDDAKFENVCKIWKREIEKRESEEKTDKGEIAKKVTMLKGKEIDKDD
jgi:hypothetical protein